MFSMKGEIAIKEPDLVSWSSKQNIWDEIRSLKKAVPFIILAMPF